MSSSGNYVMNLSAITGSSFPNFIRVFRGNRVAPEYYMRALSSGAMSMLAEPFRWYEHLRFDGRVNKFEIKEDPIFILGHWRSGTTYLHNIICHDPAMGFVNTYQGVYPELLFGGKWLFKSFMKIFLPEKRTSDNMEMSPDAPQEEEFALANINPYSYYNFWLFPERTKEFYEKYVEFNGMTDSERMWWKKDYIRLVKKALINTNGKRFVSKNPPHTGRIKLLLELFPNARFIHIHRNPVKVYISAKKFMDSTIPGLRFHSISEAETEENILWVYERIMKRYLKDRALIKKENLVEVRYDDFASDTLGEMKRIYDHLRLPNFEKVKPLFQSHVESQKEYQKNQYTMTAELVDKIMNRWEFAMKEWDYDIPSNLEIIGARKVSGY